MRIRSLVSVFTFLSLTVSLAAQSSVWKVTRGSSVFYLGGTCHVLRARDFPLPKEFDQAFAASAVVVFETDMGRLQSPATQQALLAEGMFTDGRSLATVLQPEAWKAAQDYGKKAGLPIAQFSAMKPWLFVMMISLLELQKQGVSLEGVDAHYFKRAAAERKKTGELETFEQQMKFITGIGAGNESELIVKSLEDLDELPGLLANLLGAWKAGDVAKIDELLLRQMRTQHPAIYRDLIVARNDAWLPKIEALAKTPEVEFVLVGVGHLAGKNGLPALLRAKGFTVTQLTAAAAEKK